MEMINFFDLKEEDLIVLNPYDFDKALERLNNLTLDDVKDDLKHFQKKEFEFRTYEEEVSYTLKNIRILTSSKNDKNEDEYYELKNLEDYVQPCENRDKNIEENKKIELKIINGERGKKSILLIMHVDPEKLSENILNHFIRKSEFNTARELEKYYKKLKEIIKEKKESKDKIDYRFTIKIDINYINKIYHSKDEGKYYFDLQSPPKFRTNFFNSETKKVNEEKEEKEDIEPKDENCVFPFRNFEDEISNLEYRHFIIMIEKETMDTPFDENDINENFDTNKELNSSLENLYKDRNGEVSKEKYSEKKIIIKRKDKNLKDLSYYFNYKEHKEIKEKLVDLFFIEKEKDFEELEEEEDDDDDKSKNNEKENENIDNPINEDQVIKLFYQILALVSECILSYYNASKLIENILDKKYRSTIFNQCRHEDFPKFFNLTLNKILDKYQNSLEEKSLPDFENEMKKIFKPLYEKYELDGMEEIWRPSKNKLLKRIQRCVITPSYILFTPYVLDQGNRVVREYIKSTSDTFLCTFKMDNFGEEKWSNDILVEYIKFILSKGFIIGDKKYRFFNYSQSQFRNLSCWLSTNPEQTIKKLGDFSNVRPLCKYAARISQTLTTTIRTIKIPIDKIQPIDDIIIKKEKGKKYTFSDGVGKISYILAKKINDDYLKLNYIPSCFQGRFMGCKGVWTTMWDDNSGNIYCRESQKKFDVLRENKSNFYYFELCDYSRYIQSYLNRQVILLLSALGVDQKKFMNKLNNYRKKLENQKFILSLVHYPEWNKMFNKMCSCGINRINDRLMNSLIESNLDILYDDVKNKARIYIEESAYVKGIMDEYGILNEGEAFLHIKRDNLDLILDKKCAVAKCPCLHPGDIRLLTFKKYNKNIPSTKKYEVFNRYENVVIFPSKGKRPHPNECSGSDLDGDDYFIFYDSDLIPKAQVNPMDYDSSNSKHEKNENPYTLNDVIGYFAEYINYNNLGLIGDAHMAISDKHKEGANSEISKQIAKKFSLAVDAPKTGDKVTLDRELGEEPDSFPHFMEKSKNKSYHSNSVLGKLYDESNNMIFQRKGKYLNKSFYDKDLNLNGWEKFAFLALIYYRDYFNELLKMLKNNEIKDETTLLTGNNIDNENSIFQKKKNNYDIREKIGMEMHHLFLNNQNSFYNAIIEFFINIDKSKNKINEIELINISLMFKRNLHLFASSCYMISYNLLEDVLNKMINDKPIIDSYYQKFLSLINENISSDDIFEEISEISEYESSNIGIDYYEGLECNNECVYEQVENKKRLIKEIIDKNKKDINNFIEELKSIPIPKQPNEENQYRILSFPWCIAGNALSYIKYTNF